MNRITMHLSVTMDLRTAELVDAFAAKAGITADEAVSMFVARYAQKEGGAK